MKPGIGGDGLGTKDLTQKQLSEWEDCFADIVNVLLLDGKRLIKPRDLKPAMRASLYKDKDLKLRLQERDVAKLWEQGRIRLAFIGLEGQISVQRAMPLRVIGYDGAVYRDELNRLKPEDEVDDGTQKAPLQLYPAITLVLHFDYEHRWTAPRSLKECFPHIPPELEPYINDYKIHVFEIAWLPDETISKFRSDFRFVADYYSQMRKTKKWVPMPGKVKHVKELLDLFKALTGDDRFLDMYANRKEEQNDMASIALDLLREDLRADITAEVETKVRAEGRNSAREECALAMFADHLPIDKVAKYSKLSLKKVTALGKKHGYL